MSVDAFLGNVILLAALLCSLWEHFRLCVNPVRDSSGCAWGLGCAVEFGIFLSAGDFHCAEWTVSVTAF